MKMSLKDLTTKVIILLLVLVVIFFLSSINLILAQTETLQEIETHKAQLEAELAELEKEIIEKEAILSNQKTESASIQRDVSILKTEISQAKLKIKERNLTIEKLEGQIKNRGETINQLSEKIIREKESLGQLIRKTREIDNSSSLVHIILSNNSLSDFYVDLDSFNSIKRSINESVSEIKQVKEKTEEEKTKLEEEQNSEVDAKVQIETEKRTIEKKELEKNKLLDISKNKEKEYEKIIQDREKEAAKIRSALFSLRDTVAIPFGEALEYANFASIKTGVRPALILAILTQESNLGQNVGSCYLKDPKTGDGISSKSGAVIRKIMKPSRDVQPFLEITSNLGIDSYNTLVSCPQTVGYGGAMGPSQFIPSTWKLFEPKITKAVEVRIPNPWEPKHAITATAIYLGELGADKGGFSAERDAACRYYSGRSCSDIRVKNLFYGNSVMEIATNIQENMIDPLRGL